MVIFVKFVITVITVLVINVARATQAAVRVVNDYHFLNISVVDVLLLRLNYSTLRNDWRGCVEKHFYYYGIEDYLYEAIPSILNLLDDEQGYSPVILSSIVPPTVKYNENGKRALVRDTIQGADSQSTTVGLESVGFSSCPDPEIDNANIDPRDIQTVREYFAIAMERAKNNGDLNRVLEEKKREKEEQERIARGEQVESDIGDQKLTNRQKSKRVTMEEAEAFYRSPYTSASAIKTLLEGISWEEHYDDLFYSSRAFWYDHTIFGQRRLERIRRRVDAKTNREGNKGRLNVLDMLNKKKSSRIPAFLREFMPGLTVYQTLNTSTGGTTAMRLLHDALVDLGYKSILCNDTLKSDRRCRRPSDDTIAITGEWCHEVMDDYLNMPEGYVKYPYQFRGRGVQYYLGFHHGRDSCR